MTQIVLIQVPYDSGKRDFRMGRGPAAVVAGGAAERLRAGGHRVRAETVEAAQPGVGAAAGAKPNDLETSRAATELAFAFALHRALAARVAAARAAGALPVVLAGNCASAVGTVAGLGAEGGAGLGAVWFDAHGDFNTPETSTSGFLDGMALAALAGRCWREETDALPGFRPLPEGRLALAGARDLDPAEAELLGGSGVTRVAAGEIRARGAGAALGPALDALAAAGAARLYLHLDLDVLDPAAARVNQFAAPGGLALADLTAAVGAIGARLPIAAAALTAYDPDADRDGAALAAALATLAAVAQAAG
jgi:arginase